MKVSSWVYLWNVSLYMVLAVSLRSMILQSNNWTEHACGQEWLEQKILGLTLMTLMKSSIWKLLLKCLYVIQSLNIWPIPNLMSPSTSQRLQSRRKRRQCRMVLVTLSRKEWGVLKECSQKRSLILTYLCTIPTKPKSAFFFRKFGIPISAVWVEKRDILNLIMKSC